jgi:hypothetical protein
MTTSPCEKDVEVFLGRPLTPDESVIAAYLCALDIGALEIFEEIATFIFSRYIAQIQKRLGRKLTRSERKDACKLFKKGISAVNAADKFDMNNSSSKPSRPSPR